MYNSSFLFVFGLLIGSFLNVVSLRYAEGGPFFARSLFFGRSQCPHCHKTLRWYELIPIFSFIVQAGRCRSCKQGLSWQYPLGELIAASILVTVPLALSGAPLLFIILWTLIGLTLLVLAAIDFRLLIIPDELVIFLGLLGVAGMIVQGHTSLENWVNMGAAAVFGAAFFGTIVAVTGGRAMGMGDAKLAAAMGLILGWPNIVLAIMLSFIIGAIFSVILIIIKRKTVKDVVPFGPFLAFGTLIAGLWGNQIIHAYLNIY